MKVAQQATSTGCPKKSVRNSQFLGDIKSERHDSVRDDTGHGRDGGVVAEAAEKLSEGSQAVICRGGAEGGDVLRGVGVRRRQAVGDCGEAEGIADGFEGGSAAGIEESAVVELGVDEGDVEALVVEELC